MSDRSRKLSHPHHLRKVRELILRLHKLSSSFGHPDLQLVEGLFKRFLALLLRRAYPTRRQGARHKCGKVRFRRGTDGERIEWRHKKILNKDRRKQYCEKTGRFPPQTGACHDRTEE